MSKFCGNCGKELRETAKFCPICGANQLPYKKTESTIEKPVQREGTGNIRLGPVGNKGINRNNGNNSGKKSKLVPVIIACAAAAAALCIVLFVCGVFRFGGEDRRTGAASEAASGITQASGENAVQEPTLIPNEAPAETPESTETLEPKETPLSTETPMPTEAPTEVPAEAPSPTPVKVPEEVLTPTPAVETTTEPVPTEAVTPEPAPTEAAAPAPTKTPDITEQIPIQYGLYAPEEDFIFPYSSYSYLSYDEINAALWSDDQNTRYRNGQLAINEILARYGYWFDPQSKRIGARDAAAKFGGLEWYQQAVPNCAYDDPYALIGAMNDVEKANIDAITDWQYRNDASELK